MQIIELPTEQASEAIATRFAAYIKPPLIITLSGDIGAGKTTLVRALLRALGVKTAIKSPTFSLVESYEFDDMQFHHFDLYRIHDETELDYIGFRDYFTENTICCIEWPERLTHYLERVDLACTLVRKGEGREMQVRELSSAGKKLWSSVASVA